MSETATLLPLCATDPLLLQSDSKQGGGGSRKAARDADDEFDYGDGAPASRPGGPAAAGASQVCHSMLAVKRAASRIAQLSLLLA